MLTTQTSNAYSWGDIDLLYQKACNGSCAGVDLTWSKLVTGAGLAFGATPAKRNFLVSAGANAGVDN